MRFGHALVVSAAMLGSASCNETTSVNGNTVVTTQDISGKWAGHADASSDDSLTATFVQSGTAISGGGVYWLSTSKRPIKFTGTRATDSLHVTMPDSTGSPPDTLRLLAIVSKDSFGDEIVANVGFSNPSQGLTFALHRRP